MAGRLFAVIPAAGRSRRMGRPKLLLPLGDRTVLERVVDALKAAGLADRVVVVRPDDDELAEAARRCGARVVQPETPPPEMRDSVEHALREIERLHAPDPDDGWLLIPADHPTLDAPTLVSIAETWRAARPPLLVPTHQGRRGHPTIFRWDLTPAVFALPPDAGLNRLVRERVAELATVAVDSPSILLDLDTPDDYAALCRRFETPE